MMTGSFLKLEFLDNRFVLCPRYILAFCMKRNWFLSLFCKCVTSPLLPPCYFHVTSPLLPCYFHVLHPHYTPLPRNFLATSSPRYSRDISPRYSRDTLAISPRYFPCDLPAIWWYLYSRDVATILSRYSITDSTSRRHCANICINRTISAISLRYCKWYRGDISTIS